MTVQSTASQMARALFEDYRANRIYGSLSNVVFPSTAEDAYGVQEEFLRLLFKQHGPLAGYKLAYTTRAMQQRAGWNEPVYGGICANTIYRSPATLNGADYVRLGIEFEVAVELGTDLPATKAPYTREMIGESVKAVLPAFEVIDARIPENLEGLDRTMASIATNISNAGMVLGPAVTEWREVDLVAARGIMEINGQEVGEGHGADVMGHPFEPLVWLANTLAQRGESLSAGAIVITGSIVTPKFLHAGDTATVSMDGLGEALMSVT